MKHNTPFMVLPSAKSNTCVSYVRVRMCWKAGQPQVLTLSANVNSLLDGVIWSSLTLRQTLPPLVFLSEAHLCLWAVRRALD